MSASDSRWMQEALDAARQFEGLTRPNPPVGAVVVKKGRLLGRGAHPRAGKSHAEPLALGEAGAKAKGADLFVTLEPCSTTGRTPPCVEAIVQAGIRRVVVGCADPNPAHAGRGLELLREAGVEVVEGVEATACQELIAPFATHQRLGRPRVVLKLGMTLDGRISDKRGRSQWITGPAARARVQEERRRSDAILVGNRTAMADNPSLWPRPAYGRQPFRVILDARERLPTTLQVFTDHHARHTLRVCGPEVIGRKESILAHNGVETVRLPLSRDGRISLPALFRELGKRDCLRVWCEGGGRLAGGLLDAQLADELWCFVSPTFLGGPGLGFDWLGVHMEHIQRWRFRSTESVGEDVLLRAERPEGS